LIEYVYDSHSFFPFILVRLNEKPTIQRLRPDISASVKI